MGLPPTPHPHTLPCKPVGSTSEEVKFYVEWASVDTVLATDHQPDLVGGRKNHQWLLSACEHTFGLRLLVLPSSVRTLECITKTSHVTACPVAHCQPLLGAALTVCPSMTEYSGLLLEAVSGMSPGCRHGQFMHNCVLKHSQEDILAFLHVLKE